MELLEEVKAILGEVLQLGNRAAGMDSSTWLLGSIPEFDSMAVVTVIAVLEERFEFEVADDEIDAATFETVGTLVSFVKEKLN